MQNENLLYYISNLDNAHVFHIEKYHDVSQKKELFAYKSSSQGFWNTTQTCSYYL